MGPRTFLTVREFIWHNCSAVCGLSAWQLYGGVNGDLLEEGLCHTLCDSGLLHPEPLPVWQATADLYRQETLKHSKEGLAQSLWGPGEPKVLFEPSERLRWVWGFILNSILPLLLSLWDFFFALGHVVSFLVGSNILLLMVVPQCIVTLEFSQEKMSAHPSTPPSCQGPAPENHKSELFFCEFVWMFWMYN